MYDCSYFISGDDLVAYMYFISEMSQLHAVYDCLTLCVVYFIFCVDLHIFIYDCLTLYLEFIIIKHRSSKMVASSSSQSRRKTKLVGLIQIDRGGCSFGPHYDALSNRISHHVCYCDEFSLALTLPDHKNSRRVEALQQELAASCVMLY